MLRISILVGVLLAMCATGVMADTIYTTHQGSRYGTIDTVTGIGTDIGAFGYTSTFGNAVTAGGTHYGTANSNKLGTINAGTGALTVLGNLPEFDYAIDFATNGDMYGLATSGRLHELSTANGSSLNLVGATGISATMDISIDSTDRLWATVSGRLYEVNLATGAIISNIAITGVTQGAGSVMGLMHGTDGTAYITTYTSNSALYSLNTTTGAASFIGNTGLNGAHGGDITSATAVPLPAAAWLGLSLLGALGLGRRIRRRKAA